MRKIRTKKMINVMTTGVLTTCLLSTSLIQGDNSFAQSNFTNSNINTSIKDLDNYIKNISNSDREKIHSMQEMNIEGLKISPNINLNDTKPLNVIVQFKQAPTEVDFKIKQSSGLKASIGESREKVEESHKKFKEQLKGYIKLKSADIKREYKHSFNGVSMKLAANQVQKLLSLDTVLAVWEDKEIAIEPSVEETIEPTNSAAKALDNIEHIGATKLHKEGITGKGIKVGVIDTGIDHTHPDLKDVYKGGFDFVNNDTDPMETTYEDWKISNLPEFHQLSNAPYWTNHGTHVSGIIAGTGKNSSDFAITGVAPEVELYGYKVLGPYSSGLSSVIMAGIDEAVKDKMDVINLSLGSDITDPLNPLSVAINNATLAGTVAVLAAGNDGTAYTIGNPASSPLGITVGATSSPVSVETSNGVIKSSNEAFNLNKMRLMALNYQTDLDVFKGSSTPIVYVEKGEMSSYWDKEVKDRVVLIERGNISLYEKIMWAKENGAKAVIMYNNVPDEDYIPYYFGYSFDFIPTFSILNEQGTKIVDMLKDDEVNLTINEFGEIKTEGDKLADFSSRGPSRRIYDIKPEVTAPGVGVFSSVPAYSNGEGHRDDYQYAYARFSGTSMAAPHVAGSAALILQSHPEYTPEDVKLALMNTADELNGSYSVFETGAGRIDVYEAVHSNIKVAVKGEIPTIENGQKVLIPESAGDLAYGPIAESKKDYKIKRNIEITNSSNTKKIFEVKVQFNTIGSVSQDAVKNGISLEIPTEVAVNAKGTSTIKTNLNISKDADLGLYEGYIYLTNKADSSEIYQIPLGFKKLKEGIQELLVPFKSFATRRDLNNGYMGYTPVLFSFSSRMESFDIVLKNADTGEALGIIDAYHNYVNEDILVGLEFGFVGLYFPFTGNKDQPISLVKKLASPGRYEIEIVSTNEDGEVFKKSQQVFIDNTLPEVKMNIPGGVYEVGDNGLKISGSIYDSNVDVMNKYGFNFDQSSNKINALVTQPFDFIPLTIDSKGNFEYQRAIQPGEESTNITLQTFDNAINGMQDHPDFTYTLVKKGTPYTKITSDKNNVKYGDTFTVTLSEHNIKDLMGGEFTLTYSNQVFELQGVELNGEFVEAAQSKGLNANLSKEETTMGATTDVKLIPILDGANPSSGITENLPIANLTFKVKDNPSTYVKWIQQININSATAYVLDQAPITINKFGQGINVIPTYSVLEGGFLPDGFIPPGMLWLDEMKDYSKVGAEVFMIDEDGKRYDATINSYARFSVKNLPLINQSYELVVKVPGHFERHTKIDDLIDLYEGQKSGKLKYIFYGTARAGDVNDDKVIDILDAVYISEKLKTNDRNADINYDGIVDVKDIKFVKDNYMLQNPDFTVHKKPVTKYMGKVLEDILKPFGIN